MAWCNSPFVEDSINRLRVFKRMSSKLPGAPRFADMLAMTFSSSPSPQAA
eukprot:CAMPEP_0172901000 /NCGR_PEP_ID=MMETSP1075-20121228/165281_1 /TAXON_ID=2916 /ORGANISM="Ceratium fusus, Strain PA161109" /LENGTH=49 /DNA_ID= /DNA_START= /DNA_END= /DNA_ORIENTATION=